MGFRSGLPALAIGALASWLMGASITCCALARGLPAALYSSGAASQGCRVAVLEGEAEAGHAFERPIGNGLKILLEPIASGWILRVVPVEGPRGQHDYAELATPPYQSVSPLLIGTDFSFRAQDALAWNPRHFRFAANGASFMLLMAAYSEEQRLTKPGPAAAEPSRMAALRLAEFRLATLVSQAPEAELTILDARLVQGTADQAQTAAMVASHLNRSSHQVDQPAAGQATPLGRLDWIKFRIRLDLLKTFRVDKRLSIKQAACL